MKMFDLILISSFRIHDDPRTKKPRNLYFKDFFNLIHQIKFLLNKMDKGSVGITIRNFVYSQDHFVVIVYAENRLTTEI